MAKLIINPTSSSRREIALARTIVSIGRDPSNDVVLPDAMVSRRHAVIEYRGSQYFLRDCNSSNGSLVNGDRVSERNLRDGDLVAIGTARPPPPAPGRPAPGGGPDAGGGPAPAAPPAGPGPVVSSESDAWSPRATRGLGDSGASRSSPVEDIARPSASPVLRATPAAAP